MTKTINVRKITRETIESPDGTNSYEPPNGWRAITPEELALSHFTTQFPDFIECRQFNWDKESAPYGKMRIHAMMYWYPDKTGVAFHNEWVYDPKTHEGEWKVMYFAFGCKHQFRELSREECRALDIPHYGNCWHVEECQQCQRITSYSSDG